MPLTNQAQGPYWGIFAQGCGSMDHVQQGPYKKRPRANIPQYSSNKLTYHIDFQMAFGSSLF